jgi:hypothetical protein
MRRFGDMDVNRDDGGRDIHGIAAPFSRDSSTGNNSLHLVAVNVYIIAQ